MNKLIRLNDINYELIQINKIQEKLHETKVIILTLQYDEIIRILYRINDLLKYRNNILLDYYIELFNENYWLSYELNRLSDKNILLEYDNNILKEKYDEIKNTYRCSICYDNNKNIIIEPCMHFCCCNSCSYMIDKCPICRGEIGQFLRIF